MPTHPPTPPLASWWPFGLGAAPGRQERDLAATSEPTSFSIRGVSSLAFGTLTYASIAPRLLGRAAAACVDLPIWAGLTQGCEQG